MTWLFTVAFFTLFNFAHMGFAVAGNAQTSEILAVQLNWGDKENFWVSGIQAVTIFGGAFGSFASNILIKQGSRRSMLILNGLLVLAVIPTLLENIWSYLIGKFLFGLLSSALLNATACQFYETIPVQKSHVFGMTTNFGLVLGITISLFLGYIMPINSSPEAASTDTWKYFNSFPIFLSGWNILFMFVVLKKESLKFLIRSGLKKEALLEVSKIYITDSAEEAEQILEDVTKVLQQMDLREKPSYKAVLS